MAELVEFQFVNSTPNDPAVPQDKAVRAMIRKQAMKKASAARRRDANYGQHNLRQLPVFPDRDLAGSAARALQSRSPETESDPESVGASAHPASAVAPVPAPAPAPTPAFLSASASRARGAAAARSGTTSRAHTQKRLARQVAPLNAESQMLLRNYLMHQGLVSPLSPTGYEAMSTVYGFDLLELSTLATMHVGRATRHAISADPYHLVHQMRAYRQWSYLSFLPARYGHAPCLKEAADCCVARAQQIVQPRPGDDQRVRGHYAKALRTLNRALGDPLLRYTPDVLCAIQILAMYELLDPAGEDAWISHASGAGQLIELRGPEGYQTDYEKALLMAHVGPLITEALINNQATFLAQPAWQDVLRSLVLDNPAHAVADRSEIVIALHILKSHIPGFFRDVTVVLCGAAPTPHPAILALRDALNSHQCRLLEWRKRYERTLASMPSIRMETIEYDHQCKIFATYLSCQMVTNRLLGALSPYARRRRLEAESQMLVKEMTHMENRALQRKSSALLFMVQTAGVAGSIKASLNSWLGGGGGGGGSGSASPVTSSPATSSPVSISSSGPADSPGSEYEVNVVETLLPAENLRAWCQIMGRKCL